MGKRADPATDAWALVLELTFGNKERFMAAAQEIGLAPMQAHALRVLEQPISMSDLADQLHCDASNVTGIVDRLEHRELVERVADPADRRVKKLRLTEAGLAARERFLARMHVPPAALSSLSKSDLLTLREILGRALG